MSNGSQKVSINESEIDELLTRSVVEIFPSRAALKRELLSGKRLKIYIGADPTGIALHLGHTTNYIIIEKFRKMGHKVVVLIGDFTARIGDPTDKGATRVQLSRDEVIKNSKSWIEQLSPLVDFDNTENPVDIVYNHEWLSKMSFEDVINLSSNFTVQQMLERDMFQKRLRDEKPIYVHEFFYPLMQGFDSVKLDVDMEICGNDQTFNALTGRTLAKRLKNKEKFVFATTLLENPKTGEKMMSKSLGTGVFLNENPNEMFGKIMAQPDENIPQLFRDCTYINLKELKDISKKLENGTANPRDIKLKLAFDIVKIYHGESHAESAKGQFEKTFSRKEIPDDLQIIKTKKGQKLSVLLLENKLVSSMGDFKRLVNEGAIKKNGTESISDFNFIIESRNVFKIGKKKFIQIDI